MTAGDRSGAAPRVLLVDDDDTYRSILVMLVEDEGFSSIEAGSLAEAREVLAARRPFDVVLLDAALPDGRGLSLVPEIIAARPGARIILLSGSDSTHSAGPSEHVAARLLKGGAPEELLALLRRTGQP